MAGEAFAIPNQEASTVAEVLVENVFSRFGTPLELHLDQGRNFESKVFQKVCQILSINKTRTSRCIPSQMAWLSVSTKRSRNTVQGCRRASEGLGPTSTIIPNGLQSS